MTMKTRTPLLTQSWIVLSSSHQLQFLTGILLQLTLICNLPTGGLIPCAIQYEKLSWELGASSFFVAKHLEVSEIVRNFASGMDNKPTATSYKRRLNDWDYSQPRIYMLTLATEGRQPLFGTLTGDPTLPAAAPRGLICSPRSSALPYYRKSTASPVSIRR